jgi:hypothetical protein
MVVQLSSLWSLVIGVTGLVLTILNISDKIQTRKEKAKEPNKLQDERITKLENELVEVRGTLLKYDSYFAHDKLRMDKLELGIKATNKIIIKSLQALTEHALDGNSIDKLKDSKEEIDNYLLNK